MDSQVVSAALQGLPPIRALLDWWRKQKRRSKVAVSTAAILAAIWYYRYRIRPMLSIKSARGKAVFVTGCDTGFGNMLAKRLDVLGFRVFAGCLSEQSAAKLKSETSAALTTLICDVTKEDQIVAAAREVEAQCPQGLYAVVNNAGVSDSFLAHVTRPEAVRRTMEINFIGTVAVNYHFFELIRRAKGRIVNMASVWGYFSGFGFGPYSASKFAVQAYSEALRQEVEGFGMKVIVIEPGLCRTPLMTVEAQKGIERTWQRAEESRKNVYVDREKFFKGCQKSLALLQYIAEDPKKVVNAYERALVSAYPRTRYTPTMNSKLFYGVSQLPDFLKDCLAKYILCPKMVAVDDV
uniref:Uncharacterized protein n=1 Tax=Chromera velia CCMP2878 TaxID=1169474 RepID=A0A0G4GB33_9ALVE|mmetsp:Transcript_29792/g.58455  ORF Transcript_29792/g.58455 Transcript_29792/m.58455 type:complete len:351 (+) Transcript_29792:182-1234(+)|eukprot:Cvel_21092.t1-p1 / transcript=Cvel_21092.t1 / gene=Cvel_21092 / organism=Chromera_velia_CCMP2878 / gene_product=Retinol dehydrogenase 3, putative / transcript_product=Retinol dehydrogenase 3, putative / location=Cvel_scaffold1950:14892-17240(-) / protein_length=350 / sequence_SO=supercontig / SO=protein_coding / is_pseudo=false